MPQKQTSKSKQTEDETDVEPKALESDVNVDDILDEIDSVLEENAEEFVSQYIQKGGQ